MPPNKTAEEIQSQVFEWLKKTRYSATSIEPMSGGTGNFIYRARLEQPLRDGSADVLVKHGEGYVATNQEIPLTTDRCRTEEECLKAVMPLRVQSEQAATPFNFVVRSPACHLYDEEAKTQVQECLPQGTNLKTYILENFPPSTPESHRPQCHQLGKLLAQYITQFHRKTEHEVQEWRSKGAETLPPKLYAQLKAQEDMQGLKHMINYDWLLERVDMFPEILEQARDVFNKVKQLAVEELDGAHTELLPIHGDFWTGNILLPSGPILPATEIPVFIIDWELAQLGVRSLDHGQMIAELYMLWLYKHIDAGLWVIQGYTEGLGKQSDSATWRTAIQVGCHLLSFGTVTPGWGTPEQVEQVARVGRDIIVNAWNRNREWFGKGDLGCLFTS